MRSTFKVLFYLKRNAPKKNGLVPVMCRVTVNGKVSQFSCKLDVEEKSWNVELGRLSGRSLVAQEGNRMLDKIRVGINKAYQEICDRDNYVTAEKVRNAFLGLGMKHETLLAVFTQHNEDYAKQVGKIKSERSYWKYCTVYNHLTEFAGNQSGGLCDQSGPRPAAAACGAAACVMAGWILPVHFQKRISSNIRSSSLCQRGFPFFSDNVSSDRRTSKRPLSWSGRLL